MEGTSFHLSRLTKCEKYDGNEPEYDGHIVREFPGSKYSRLVIPFEADIEHWKQHVLAETLANRVRDHYVGFGLTAYQETPSLSFELERGPQGRAYASIRLPRDVHVIPEGLSGLSSLGRIILANAAPEAHAETRHVPNPAPALSKSRRSEEQRMVRPNVPSESARGHKQKHCNIKSTRCKKDKTKSFIRTTTRKRQTQHMSPIQKKMQETALDYHLLPWASHN